MSEDDKSAPKNEAKPGGNDKPGGNHMFFGIDLFLNPLLADLRANFLPD